jgi:hypothetical protein
VFSIKKQLFLIGKHFSFLKTGGQAIEGGGFVGSWREVAGMTVRKRTTLVVVCGFGALRYMFFCHRPSRHGSRIGVRDDRWGVLDDTKKCGMTKYWRPGWRPG